MQIAGVHTPVYVIMNIHRDKDGFMMSVMECDNYMYVAGVKVKC